jgi:hypothetical protein
MESRRLVQARGRKLGSPLPQSALVEAVQATLRINVVMLLALKSFSDPVVIFYEINFDNGVIMTL